MINHKNTSIMKTRYNKSKIMKEANRLMRVEGYSRSVALTLAWDKARRSEFYLIIEVRKPQTNVNVDYSNPMIQASLSSYYANNTYNGD